MVSEVSVHHRDEAMAEQSSSHHGSWLGERGREGEKEGRIDCIMVFFPFIPSSMG
jgi:hypothetical protein